MNAKVIGAEIGKQALVSIPFCGGCSEVVHIDARQILLNDLHRHIITLGMTVADDTGCAEMVEQLEDTLVHPDYLDAALDIIAIVEDGDAPPAIDSVWAAAYFTVAWLSRSSAGSDSELSAGLASRRTASGGSSVKRWRSAVEGLPAWHKVLKTRCAFSCLDWRDWMAKVHDEKNQAVYADPPWRDAGKRYKHRFTKQDHIDLAARLHEFKNCRVVIRHSDHPLYRELYQNWTWVPIGGRNQGNKAISEALIINGPSFTEETKSLF